jgi:phospholipid/cholesterol/gamma-HCH transport system substrate-binding protein
MYVNRTTQFIVGSFVLVGIIALVYLSVSLGNVQIFSPSGYRLYADFDNISGVKSGDAVEIAGVDVGRVTNLSLVNGRARVTMWLRDGTKVDRDAVASVRSRGIIGDKYVAISLGPSDKLLSNGDTIRQTESSFVLEDAIGQLINNIGSSGSKAKE